MLKALLGVFRTYDPLGDMGQNFSAMLTLADEITVAAGEMFFAGSASPEARRNLYQHDQNSTFLNSTQNNRGAGGSDR